MALRVEDIDLAADRELVERWQAGEHAAFDDLYRRYFGRLRSYCQRRVGDRDTAEEIAQEAFVKALQALPRFGGERRFYPWVTVIAARLCVDHHRRLGRVRPTEDIDPGVVDGDHGTRLAFLADVDNLDRALQRLGPRHIEVLDLRERQEMSYAQIAAHLEVPQSTVEALLFRARKALRREFLAISGEGRLASIPVLGALVRRLGAARGRVGDLLPSLSQLSGPVAAGAMAAVITVSPFTAAQAAAPPPAARPAVVRTVTTSAPAITHDANGTTPAPVAPTRSPQRLQAPPTATAVSGVETVSADEAREESDGMSLELDLGEAGAGVDPTTIAGWLPEHEEEN